MTVLLETAPRDSVCMYGLTNLAFDKPVVHVLFAECEVAAVLVGWQGLAPTWQSCDLRPQSEDHS
jgi:hypothetical protein